MTDERATVDRFHAAISAAVDDRTVLAQDLIDVAAAAAGLKPSAVVGFGYSLTDAARQVGAAARVAGMVVAECRPWRATCDVENLPAWYADEVAGLYEAVRVLVFAPRPEELRALSASTAPLTGLLEATALGYPQCCVDAYHQRRNAYHLLNLRMLSRQTDGNEEAMKRLFRAGVTIAPKDDAEADDLTKVTRTVFAPFTSIAICDACDTNDDSPARRISKRFRSFAEQSDMLRYLPAQG